MKKNAFYAQSGGVTSVINSSAAGVIDAVRNNKDAIGTLYAGKNGILGALNEQLIDTNQLSDEQVQMLRYTPSAIFGSCRYKLKSLDENKEEYLRLIEVFKAHNIGYFFYNGGGDSQDTAHKVSLLSKQMGFPITCIGIPKTIDNDLPYTDNSPGFGSVAKYVATSTKEVILDVKAMCVSSTKVFILEVMGRNAGWIAASSALAQTEKDKAPHIILLPEVSFDEKLFVNKVDSCVKKYGFCCVVASEGVKNSSGEHLTQSYSQVDAFGHQQLGGVALVLADLVKKELGYKYHWAVSDYLQRSARHIASAYDVNQAYKLGYKAVELALDGEDSVMPTTIRIDDGDQITWKIDSISLSKVANIEKKMPKSFISSDNMQVTSECIEYLKPLVQGEDFPPFNEQGIPAYLEIDFDTIKPKLPYFQP